MLGNDLRQYPNGTSRAEDSLFSKFVIIDAKSIGIERKPHSFPFVSLDDNAARDSDLE